MVEEIVPKMEAIQKEYSKVKAISKPRKAKKDKASNSTNTTNDDNDTTDNEKPKTDDL